MTPAARAAAAIAVLDRILTGEPAEQALTNWGRASRFAGSGDRYAVRDLVYDALRCKRSFAALGGGVTGNEITGRALILGGLIASGGDPGAIFTGEGHAPAALGPADKGREPEGAEALDVPDWVFPHLVKALGDDLEATLQALRHRAPVYLRVNSRKASLSDALAALAAEGIVAQPVEGLENGLEATENARKIHQSRAYLDGLVELQDASSQAVVEALPLRDGMRVLDHCAGGGGKALAMAAQAGIRLYAHDAAPQRLRDLVTRAGRAGVKAHVTDNPEKTAPYDLTLTDVPCSGSGSWRRDPMGKWQLTAGRLAELVQVQASILERCAPMVAPKGHLAYATCSLLREENEDQIAAFLGRHPEWTCGLTRRFSPLSGGDGFFLALLSRQS